MGRNIMNISSSEFPVREREIAPGTNPCPWAVRFEGTQAGQFSESADRHPSPATTKMARYFRNEAFPLGQIFFVLQRRRDPSAHQFW